MNLLIDPAVAVLIVACAALLFASGAIHKLRDLRHFNEMFAAYGLLPGVARPLVAKLVPVGELAVAGGLLFDAARPLAVVGGTTLLLIYAAAIGINLLRGRRDLACGCGGPGDRRPIAAWMVWRNVGLAVLLAMVLLPVSPRLLSAMDAVTIGFGTATCALIYMCMERLLSRPAGAYFAQVS